MPRTVLSVPLTVPVTLLRPRRGWYATSTSTIRQPRLAARTTISSGQPNRRSTSPRPSSASRLAALIGPMSRTRTWWRARKAAPNARFAMRACAGHAPAVARLRPITRSAWPSRTGPATLGRSAPAREPSQSMKHTTSDCAARRPVKHAAPKPRCGSLTTVAPRLAASRSEPSVEPLSTTMARYPSGREDNTPGSARLSSSTGRITSTMGGRR
jgi:hypothetical protein